MWCVGVRYDWIEHNSHYCDTQAYYDELLQGKTGRIDLKLKDLKQQ